MTTAEPTQWLAEKYGYRAAMCYSLFATIAFIFLFFFAQNLQMLLAAKILIGVPLGGAYHSQLRRCIVVDLPCVISLPNTYDVVCL